MTTETARRDRGDRPDATGRRPRVDSEIAAIEDIVARLRYWKPLLDAERAALADVARDVEELSR